MTVWKFISQAPGTLKLSLALQVALMAILIYRGSLEQSSMEAMISLVKIAGGASMTEASKAVGLTLIEISVKKNWLMLTEFLCLAMLWAVTGRLIKTSKTAEQKAVI